MKMAGSDNLTPSGAAVIASILLMVGGITAYQTCATPEKSSTNPEKYQLVCRYEAENPGKEEAARRLNARIEECYQEYKEKYKDDEIGGYYGFCLFRLEDEILGTEDLFQRNELELKCEEKQEE